MFPYQWAGTLLATVVIAACTPAPATTYSGTTVQDNQLVCNRDNRGGSRIKVTTCKTRAERTADRERAVQAQGAYSREATPAHRPLGTGTDGAAGAGTASGATGGGSN